MKLLTVAIPCYNSQEYMKHAIESALVGGEDIEVLIVDDGSKDDTAKIAVSSLDPSSTMDPKTIRRRLPMSLKHNIRGLSVPSIRKMVGTARLSMPASAMPRAFITKCWIPMIGWTAMPFCA